MPRPLPLSGDSSVQNTTPPWLSHVWTGTVQAWQHTQVTSSHLGPARTVSCRVCPCGHTTFQKVPQPRRCWAHAETSVPHPPTAAPRRGGDPDSPPRGPPPPPLSNVGPQLDLLSRGREAGSPGKGLAQEDHPGCCLFWGIDHGADDPALNLHRPEGLQGKAPVRRGCSGETSCHRPLWGWCDWPLEFCSSPSCVARCTWDPRVLQRWPLVKASETMEHLGGGVCVPSQPIHNQLLTFWTPQLTSPRTALLVITM